MPMSKIISVILILACFSFAENSNKSISLYIHPISLAYGMGMNTDNEEGDPSVIISNNGIGLILYLTLEVSLNEFNSLIINPSSWWIDNEQSDDAIKRVGSGVGIRHFLYGESEGLYLQAMPSLHYLSLTEGKEKHSGFFADILGYIGYSANIGPLATFADFGLGYAYANVPKSFCHKGCLYFDINMGIGVSF
jgi:hypothetical protein